MSIAPCPPQTVVRGVVVFDLPAFRAQFPQFNTVADAAVQFNFTLATFLLNNSCQSIVQDALRREQLLNLLVAHVTALLNGENGQPPQGIVGRINNATEGSVSVAAEFQAPANATQAAFIQTKYGAMFWTMTAVYRTARYIPAPQSCGYGPGVGIGPTGTGCGYNGGSA